MSTSIGNLSVTSIASGSVPLYVAVGYDGAVAAPGAAIRGVAYTPGEDGQPHMVHGGGEVQARSGAAFDAGDPLEVGADGAFVPHDAGVISARAVDSADAAGELPTICIIR